MNSIEKFLSFLEERLKAPLPGYEAQKMMIPFRGEEPLRNMKPSPDARNSAVLILCRPNEAGDDLDILLTLRSENLKSHKGQISLPGGRTDGDETPVETALRETYEEVGIEKQRISILGELSPLFVPHSKSVISPVVAVTGSFEPMMLNPEEVDEAFVASLNHLADRKNIEYLNWIFNDMPVDVPSWKVHPRTPLWGATAIILSELIYLWDEWKGVPFDSGG